MRFSTTCPLMRLSYLASILFFFVFNTSAQRIIFSTSIEPCMENSTFTASLLDVAFTPDNHSLAINVVADSSTTGNVMLYVHASAYGYNFLTKTINPCTSGFSALCPLSNLQINFDTVYNNISKSVIDSVPSIAYGFPDLDADVQVYMAKTDALDVNLACVRVPLSNGKTVYQAGVGWATAVIAVLGLLTSAVVSGFGHYNTASHVATYALCLFTYFQSVAIIGLCAVPLPPMVQSWTQDFVWSMGIIRIGFLQSLATWYQKSTGGTPSTILDTLATTSVEVLKRSLDDTNSLVARGSSMPASGEYVVMGIERVAFRANMEATNLFLTGIIFFAIFVIFTVLGVVLFKQFLDVAIKAGWMRPHRFQAFRDDFLLTLKGIIYRILMIGFPQLTILCLWEFTRNDSAGEVALAVFIFFGTVAALSWAVFQLGMVARRSQQMYKTPAYILFTNPMSLNKWGFLYVQYQASTYWYIIPTLGYILVKGMFVGLAQSKGTVQAIALLIIEALALIAASVVRPWMDKPTNGINIAICAVNFVNAVLLLIFTGIFNGPGLLIGVSGVIFFVLNAVFALVLLIVLLVAIGFSSFQKNPDTRYQPVSDNRASFVKSQTALTTELDALGQAARGSVQSYGDKDAFSTDYHALTPQDNRLSEQNHNGSIFREPMASPHSPSFPMMPSQSRIGSEVSSLDDRQNALQRPRGGADSPYSNAGPRFPAADRRSHSQHRAQNNNSPWQRGAGYDSYR